MEGWNTNWLGMPNIIPMEAQKFQEVMNSQENLITM
jgi:hypothetical protein